MQDVIDFNLLKEYDTALKEVLGVWTKQKAYSINDTIQYKGKYLKCTTAGTTGTTTLNFTGLDVGDTITDGTVVWEIIEPPSGGVDLPEWQANTSYTAGKYLVHEGTVYKVTTNFTSGTTFDDTNLSAYIAPIMTGATSSNDGKSGIVPTPTTNDVDKFLKGDGTWTGLSSSGLFVSKKILYSGTFNDIVLNTPITLTDNINNYDKINIIGKTVVNSSDSYASIETLVNSNIGYFVNFVFNGASMTPNYVNIGSSFDTTTPFYVEGIKFIPSNNVYTSKNLLWSGTHLDIASVNTITLNDNITNYDSIIFTLANGTASEYIELNSSVSTMIFFMESYTNNPGYIIEFSGYCLYNNANVLNILLNQFGTNYNTSNPCIIDIYGLKFTPNPNDYSTTERKIGTWIDGKPLYQVTLTGTTDSNTNTTTRYSELPYNDLTPYNIDTVVDITGGCYNTNNTFTPFGKFQLAYTSQFYEDNRSVLNVYTDKDTSDNNKLKLYITSGNWYAGLDYFVTIKYTKT